VGHLNELNDEYAGKGFTVLAVTNEDRAKVDEFVANLKPTYPVVIEGGDSLQAFGGSGFPSSYLIAPDGTIAWSGHPAAVPLDTLEELLSKAEMFPDLPREFSSVRHAIQRGHFQDAQKALTRKIEGGDLDEEGQGWAKKLQGWLDWNRDSATRRATTAIGKGDFYGAWKTYDDIAHAWKGADIAKDAEAKVKEMLHDKAKREEIDAGKKLARIRRRLGKASPGKAIKLLEPLTRTRYKDTFAGKQAAALIQGYQKQAEALK
jgi:hypothetical protein